MNIFQRSPVNLGRSRIIAVSCAVLFVAIGAAAYFMIVPPGAL